MNSWEPGARRDYMEAEGFVGFPPEIVGGPDPVDPLERSRMNKKPGMTPAEWREQNIAEGLCPMVGCGGTLDKDLFCSQCGEVSLPRPVEAVLEDSPEYIPTIPGALWPVDEYAPAEVDAA